MLRPLVACLAAVGCGANVSARSMTAATVGVPREVPDWVYSDTNMVEDQPWIAGIYPKDVVVVLFKRTATQEEHDNAIRAVKGRLLAFDGMFSFTGIRSHPDACTVKQAEDLLRSLPGVATAVPDMTIAAGTVPNPSHHPRHGSTTPSPDGTDL